MNITRHNEDLRILTSPEERERPRFGESPSWTAVDWQPTKFGGNVIFLRQYVLPRICSHRRTDVRIEAPPNLYEPADSGSYYFYRNIWLAPDLEVWDPRRKRWARIPRLFEQTGDDGFAYLCIHPQNVSGKENILTFLRILDLHIVNPGLHASAGEVI